MCAVRLGVLMVYWNSSGAAHNLGARLHPREENCAKFGQYMRSFWTFGRSVSVKINPYIFSPILERFKISLSWKSSKWL